MTTYKPLRFIGANIEVLFDKEPTLAKTPDCPDRFIWEGNVYIVVESLAEWQDYGRSGDMSHNMRPANLAKANKRGSWGVGRFYFRVYTAAERIFELYYDRAPKDVDDRLGDWFLDREMVKVGD
jgi:hypothetical protein